MGSFIGVLDRGDDGLLDGARIIVIGGLVQKIWLNGWTEVAERVPPCSSFWAQGFAVDIVPYNMNRGGRGRCDTRCT